MNPNYLDFEQPIADLEARIQDLRSASAGPAVHLDAEVHALPDKLRVRTAQIFRDLAPWQVSQLARHPARPYTLDYIRVFCDEFQELAGDRAYADDAAIVGGRYLALVSGEVTHWLNESWGIAGFIDAGDAVDDLTDARLAVGYGLGARWRSPAGPSGADIAYGQRTGDLHLHFSLAIPF